MANNSEITTTEYKATVCFKSLLALFQTKQNKRKQDKQQTNQHSLETPKREKTNEKEKLEPDALKWAIPYWNAGQEERKRQEW